MYRNAIKKLIEWKNDPQRKPLIIKGARQVGKTWLMEEFGRKEYDNYIKVNFDKDDEIASLFEKNKDPKRLIELLSMLKNIKILPGKTLIIFDEIQESPAALNSLKYFCEEASEYHIVTGGSLLGTLLAKAQSYPVGKVNILEMHPLTFGEFLLATDEGLYEYYSKIDSELQIAEVFNTKLIEAYRYYLIIGGMPECVDSWFRDKDPQKLTQIQSELIKIYENDFAKHNGKINAARILMVFRSLVTQLAKDNEKFIFGKIKEGARAREYEEAIEWLVSAGMINRVYSVSKPEHPLKVYSKLDSFKLFVFDTGLLKHMAGIDNGGILLDESFQFKGPLAENFVLQQIKNTFDVEPFYYSERGMEIDFIVQQGSKIIPIEVKSGTNKSAASIKKYNAKFNSPFAIRFSGRGLKKDEAIFNIPIYLAERAKSLISGFFVD